MTIITPSPSPYIAQFDGTLYYVLFDTVAVWGWERGSSSGRGGDVGAACAAGSKRKEATMS